MIALLIDYAATKGYDVRISFAYRCQSCPIGSRDSFHKKYLAIDLDLFRNGNYLKDINEYHPLGVFWESIGGSWGGRFRNPEKCHFSLGE